MYPLKYSLSHFCNICTFFILYNTYVSFKVQYITLCNIQMFLNTKHDPHLLKISVHQTEKHLFTLKVRCVSTRVLKNELAIISSDRVTFIIILLSF